MNEPPIMEAAPRLSLAKRLVRWALWLAVGFLLLLCLAPGFLLFGLIEPLAVLGLGWLKFLYRTVPQVSWNWDLVGMAVLSCVAILILAQALFAWGTKHFARARGQQWMWPWKWTWSGLLAILLFFLVGMSVGGAVHQIGWMISSREPWFEEKRGRWRDVTEMRGLEMAFREALQDAQGNLATVRQKLWKQPGDYISPSRLASTKQSYHLLVVTTEGGKVEGTIIFPRNAEKLSLIGGIHTFGSEKGAPFPANELPALLEKYRHRLVAF